MGRVILLVAIAACGRDTSVSHDRDWPTTNGDDAPLPDASLATDTSPSGISPLSTSFKGGIADLRKAPNLKNGLRVKIPEAVVFAINGGGDYMYVSDAVMGEASGLEVQRCLGADTVCKKARPNLGEAYALSGTLAVAREGTLSLVNVKADLIAGETIDLQPLGAEAGDVERGKVTGNEWAQADYVGVLNADQSWAELEVTDVEPADELNSNFPADLDKYCGLAHLADPSLVSELVAKHLSCCPAGVGPKYGNVHLTDKQTGKQIALGTGNYKDITFTGWPCSDQDLGKALRVGDRFTRLQGVFSVKRGAAVLSPTRESDYALLKK